MMTGGSSEYDWAVRIRRLGPLALGLGGVAAMTGGLRMAGVTNATTVALSYLLVVLFVASLGDILSAVVTSVAAMLCFNYFFLPPVGTFTVADPQNWIALFAFLAVSVVASRLSTAARAKAQEALDRRNELTRLFDLTRDILLTTEREGAFSAIARHVARRFELEVFAICVPAPVGRWDVYHGGTAAPDIPQSDIDRAFAAASGAIEFDARTRAYGGHREVPSAEGPITLVPVRIGTRAIGMVATGGRRIEAGTRDAIAGIVAIAVERADFLRERDVAELARQRAELSSALMASLSHDLRTPLTAIRTAVTNLESPGLAEDQRRDQARVAAGQIDRLTRLFDEILDMARIDAKSVRAQRAWTTPAEIVEAAVSHAAASIAGRDVRVEARDDVAVEIDPRLASSALAHLLENAARYAPEGAIHVRGWTDGEGLRLDVTDSGPGVEPSELEHLFEPFYRGELFRQRIPGTGMGLAITRGLVAADGGRVWAENVAPHGACFSIAIPAPTRPIVTAG
jgi:two-component system, OmpR family, sensor histidine kinase KdpD